MTYESTLYETPPMGEWRAEAACQGMDPALFFPGPYDDQRPAREACARCPVKGACRAEYDVLERWQPAFGIVAGESADERDRRRRRVA